MHLPISHPIPRRALRAALMLSVLAAPLAISEPAEGQGLVARERTTETTRPSIGRAGVGRMAAGDRASYELRLGGHEVGTGSLEVLGEEQIGVFNTLRTPRHASGGVLFPRVDNRFQSWIHPDPPFARR